MKKYLFSIADKRAPDKIIGIGGKDEKIETAYMLRWWVIPRNPVFNIYLHKFLRSDDDRALHDHPWMFNMSILLKGSYIEHMPANKKKWPDDQKTKTKKRTEGAIYFRLGRAPHRVELYKKVYKNRRTGAVIKEVPKPVWTLFITGPVVRKWGFYCPGFWRIHKEFTANDGKYSGVGKGCE